MERATLLIDIMLWFVVLFGFTVTMFSLQGAAFYAQLVLFVGILLLAVLAMMLVNVGVRFGHLLSGFAAALVLLNLALLYFLDSAQPVFHFTAMVAAMALFVFDVLLVGEKARMPVLRTYTKVVAGANSKFYHLPDSPEARRIKKKRVFDSVEAAKKAGLKPGPSLK